MKLPSPRRLCVIGAGDSIKNFLSALAPHRGRFAQIVVISDEAVDAAWSSEGAAGIRSCAGELGLTFEACSATDAKALEAMVIALKPNVGMVLRWRAIFAKSLLDYFDGRLFNYHPTPLPRFRGAGAGSWEVLNQEPALSVTIHQLGPKVDAGPILAQFSQPFAEPQPTTRLRNSAGEKLAVAKLFPQVARMLAEDESVVLTPQDETKATYFPMLFTPRNGFLDFAWTAEDVSPFVRAFGPPYAGASFRYADKLFHVTEASILEPVADLHPFCQGLILNVSDLGIHVACNRGIVLFTEVRDESGTVIPAAGFRIGGRLYTTPDDLLHAKLYRHAVPK